MVLLTLIGCKKQFISNDNYKKHLRDLDRTSVSTWELFESSRFKQLIEMRLENGIISIYYRSFPSPLVWTYKLKGIYEVGKDDVTIRFNINDSIVYNIDGTTTTFNFTNPEDNFFLAFDCHQTKSVILFYFSVHEAGQYTGRISVRKEF